METEAHKSEERNKSDDENVGNADIEEESKQETPLTWKDLVSERPRVLVIRTLVKRNVIDLFVTICIRRVL